jgi:hypothetical protein
MGILAMKYKVLCHLNSFCLISYSIKSYYVSICDLIRLFLVCFQQIGLGSRYL